MSRIVIECKVPVADICEDFSIPFEKPLYEVLELIKAVFSENEDFRPDESTLCCNSKTGDIYNLSHTPEELGLLNGSSISLL